MCFLGTGGGGKATCLRRRSFVVHIETGQPPRPPANRGIQSPNIRDRNTPQRVTKHPPKASWGDETTPFGAINAPLHKRGQNQPRVA